jgi:hypothetical protein
MRPRASTRNIAAVMPSSVSANVAARAVLRSITLPISRSVEDFVLETAALHSHFSRLTVIHGKEIGGAKGSRTPDLLNAIQALSQLSYGPTLRPEPAPFPAKRSGRADPAFRAGGF